MIKINAKNGSSTAADVLLALLALPFVAFVWVVNKVVGAVTNDI